MGVMFEVERSDGEVVVLKVMFLWNMKGWKVSFEYVFIMFVLVWLDVFYVYVYVYV